MFNALLFFGSPQSSEIFFSPGLVVGAAVVALTVVVETVV
jgi:hypothetical protein